MIHVCDWLGTRIICNDFLQVALLLCLLYFYYNTSKFKYAYVLYEINIIEKNGITFYDMSKDNIAIMKTNNCSQ